MLYGCTVALKITCLVEAVAKHGRLLFARGQCVFVVDNGSG